MTTRMRAVFLSLFVAMALPGAQVPEPVAALRILSPGPETFVSGPTLLRARVQPEGAASTLVFFVDGRLVCTLVTPPFECDWDAGEAVVEHQVRAVANLFGGGRVVQTVRTKPLGYTEKVDVDVVQVTVTVGDGHGRFVRGLPQAAFHVAEDGRPQRISHFASENLPLDLVVAVDISGSMAPAMPRVKKAVKEFLAAVPPETDPAERVRAVDHLASWGSTALYDVILRGVDMLGRQTGRKAMVLFTDGEDQGSHAAITDVERRLQSSDVTLYMIGQGRGVTMESLRRIMERLSNPTGGRALFTENIEELHNAFADLLDELSNQYLLGYQSSNSKRDDQWRKIKVDVDGHHDVHARQGYRAIAGK